MFQRNAGIVLRGRAGPTALTRFPMAGRGGPTFAAMTIHPTPPQRGELFSDPGARVAWNAIAALPVDQQHLVLQELQGRLAGGLIPGSPQETRIARAIGALREAAAILGASPSIKKFERLRHEHPEYGWPPAGTIRTWFGHAGWNECLKRAHLDAIPGGDVIVIRSSFRPAVAPMCGRWLPRSAVSVLPPVLASS